MADTRTVLLTLGRLPKALELTRGLHRAGCRVIVAEPFGWHVCRMSNSVDHSVMLPAPNKNPAGYRQALLDTIEHHQVDLVIPVSEEALHCLNVQDLTSDTVHFYSPARPTVLALHDKLRFADDAIAAGFTVPPTFDVSDPRAQALVEQHDVIVKPSHGCSGVGVQRLARGNALPTLSGHIAQRFVDGRHISTFSLAHHGRTRATALYEGTLMSGTVAVCFKRVREHPAITRWVERFIEQRALTGFVSFDFIVDGDGTPWAIECNPRVTSGIHFLNDDDLATAILSPDSEHPVRFRERDHFQQFYPALTETYKYLLQPKVFAQKFRTLLNARDVVWNARDPWPFVMMTPASWPILRQTIFEGKSFGDAATHDIAWHEDANAA